MSELSDLYQEVILDHNRRPHNFRVIDPATATQEGYNPLCGDRLTLYLTVRDGVIADVAFQGSGCAISKASASLMTDARQGQERRAGARAVRPLPPDDHVRARAARSPDLGKLAVLAGVREFPTRVKCAGLAWHTLKAAVSEHRRRPDHDRVTDERRAFSPGEPIPEMSNSRFLPMMPMGGASPAESPANDQSESIGHIVPDPVKMAELRPQVLDALKTIYDPEIPVNILELGLIYDVLVDADAKVGVRMTLTAPACPAAQILPGEVRDKASKVRGRHRREGRDRLGAALDQGPDVRGREAAVRTLLGIRDQGSGIRDQGQGSGAEGRSSVPSRSAPPRRSRAVCSRASRRVA